ncbi:MAG: transporter [Butyrivibrio sp.]|nr:transporter [Butyrivibrio sp.]
MLVKKLFGKIKIADVILLQMSVLVYSLSTVAANMASKHEFLSFKYILFFGLEFGILAVYAVLWQQVIKRFELSIAYSNKSIMLLWTMLWNYLIFSQGITPGKVVGVLLVMAGVVVMNIGGGRE